jgi:hypothetical protein
LAFFIIGSHRHLIIANDCRIYSNLELLYRDQIGNGSTSGKDAGIGGNAHAKPAMIVSTGEYITQGTFSTGIEAGYRCIGAIEDPSAIINFYRTDSTKIRTTD